jgi:PAS domain S-box-containing protein
VPGDTDIPPVSFMKILDSIEEAIVVVDRDMKIRLYNAPFKFLVEKFGFRKELIGTSLHDAAEFLTGKHALEYKYVFQSGKNLDTSIKKKFSSKTLWYEVVKSPFFASGEVTHVISVIRETTKQQELEQVKKESIFQIEKNMEQFAILNDHIRNPLQAIIGLAELDRGSCSEKIIENARQIDDIVKELDSGWLQSDKIREMLLRHYGLVVKRRPNISNPVEVLTIVGTEETDKIKH